MITAGSRSRKRIIIGIVVVIVALAGTAFWVSHVSPNNGRPSGDKDIAFAAAKAIHSNDTHALQRLWKDNVEKPEFVHRSSKVIRSYGSIKEVAPDSLRQYSHPGMSNWSVVADNGCFNFWTHTEGGKLVGCGIRLPIGGFCTGSYVGRRKSDVQ